MLAVYGMFALFIFSFPSLCIRSYEVAILAVLEMVGLGDLRDLLQPLTIRLFLPWYLK